MPTVQVISPGRVNIIGEHVDYAGFPVMPFALGSQAAITCEAEVGGGCGGKREGGCRLTLRSTPPRASLTAGDGEVGDEMVVSSEDGDTSSIHTSILAVAAARLRAEYAGTPLDDTPPFVPSPAPACWCIDMQMRSTLPAAAGLSSSSAFCVAVAATIVRVLRERVGLGAADDSDAAAGEGEPALVAQTLALERACGPVGGAMDQRTIVQGVAGSILQVGFYPTPTTAVLPVPPSLAFVVAHSQVRAEKAAFAGYSTRVAELQLGALVLSRGTVEPKVGSILAPLAAAYAAADADRLDGATSVAAVAASTGLDVDEVVRRCVPRGVDASSTFSVRPRVEHVFAEARRVAAFAAEVATSEPSLDRLGALLNESHASLAQLYDCSCPELDALVDRARAAGARGARLTGAGWGGCIVALCHADEAAGVAATLGHGALVVRPDHGVRVSLLSPSSSPTHSS
jgi:galactokinase